MATNLDPEREKEARDFLSSTLGRSIDGDFGEILHDGIILCEFINKLKPGTVGKINKFKQPFMKMENIGNYIEATKALGIPNEYLFVTFMTVDLYEKKNLAQVALNIITLKRTLGLGFNKAAPGASSKPVLDIPPPQAVELRADPASLVSPRTQVQVKPGTFKAGVVQTDATRACAKCPQPITGACIEAIGKFYHPDHFSCERCGKNLSNKIYHVVDNFPYCDDDIIWVKAQQKGKK